MSFIEHATLRLLGVDKVVGDVRRVTTALQGLEAISKRISSLPVGNLGKMAGDAGKLSAAMERLGRVDVNRAFSGLAGVHTSRLIAVASSVERLQSALAKPMPTTSLTRALNRINAIDTSKLTSAAGAVNSLAAAYRNLSQAQAGLSTRAPAIPRIPGQGSVPSITPGSSAPPGSGGNTLMSRAGHWLTTPYAPGPLGTAQRYLGWGTVSQGHRALLSGGAGIVDAGNQRDMVDILVADPKVRSAIDTAAQTMASDYRTQSKANLVELGRDAAQFLKPEHRNEQGLGVIMDAAAKAAAFQTSLRGNANQGNEAARQMLRALENLGVASDPKKAPEYMDSILAASLLGGKNWNPTMYATGLAQIGPQFTGGLSSRFAGVMAGMMDDVRGQMAPQVRTFMSNVTRASITDKAMEAQQQYGLRDAKGEIVGGAQFFKNPDEWIREKLKPHVFKEAGGEAAFKRMDEAQQYDVVGKVMNRAGLTTSGARAAAFFIAREEELAKLEESRARVNVSRERALRLQMTNLQQAGVSVASKWKDAVDAMTKPVQPAVAAMLGGLSYGLDRLAQPERAEALHRASPGIAGAVGLGAYAAYQVLNAVKENPAQAAHTGAMALHTRALLAASGASLLGRGAAAGVGAGALGAAAAGGGILARAFAVLGGVAKALPRLAMWAHGIGAVIEGGAEAFRTGSLTEGLKRGMGALSFGLTDWLINAAGEVRSANPGASVGELISRLMTRLQADINKTVGGWFSEAWKALGGQPEVGAEPATPGDVKVMQDRLKRAGLYGGNVDGDAGPKTQQARAMERVQIEAANDFAGFLARQRTVAEDLARVVSPDGKAPAEVAAERRTDAARRLLDDQRSNVSPMFGLPALSLLDPNTGAPVTPPPSLIEGVWDFARRVLSAVNPISPAGAATLDGARNMLSDKGTAAENFETSFASLSSIATDISAAISSGGSELAGVIDGGIASGGSMMASAIESAAANGSAMFADAISSAVANINITVQGNQGGGGLSRPGRTGVNSGVLT